MNSKRDLFLINIYTCICLAYVRICRYEIYVYIIAWLTSTYDTFSRAKKISQTSECNERVSDIF